MHCNLWLIVLGLLFAMEGVGFLGLCDRPQFHGLKTALNSMNCESLSLEEVPGDTTNGSDSGDSIKYQREPKRTTWEVTSRIPALCRHHKVLRAIGIADLSFLS